VSVHAFVGATDGLAHLGVGVALGDGSPLVALGTGANQREFELCSSLGEVQAGRDEGETLLGDASVEPLDLCAMGEQLAGSFDIGAVVGAAIGDRVSAEALTWVLAAVALLAAISAARPTAPYNLPQASFGGELGGEWPGTLSGAYRLGDEVVPYEAKRVPAALSLMSVAGLVSGLAGVGGGFMKVPVMREVMRVPIKVAAATSTFTVGVTAAVSLIVYWRQGRVDLAATSAVIIGAVIGGVVGTRVSARLAPTTTRRVIAVLLAAVAVILVVR